MFTPAVELSLVVHDRQTLLSRIQPQSDAKQYTNTVYIWRLTCSL